MTEARLLPLARLVIRFLVSATAAIGLLDYGQAQVSDARELTGKSRLEFFAKVERKMGGIRSFAAEFTQDKKIAVFKSTARSSGLLVFSAPDRLRWEIRQPFRSILIVAGDRVGKFEFEGKQRRPLDLRGGGKAIAVFMAQIRSWIRGRFDPKSDYYDVKAFLAPKPLIVLRPKIEALKKNLTAIRVELTEDLSAVAIVTITEKGGDSTTMRFKVLRRDAVFPPHLFAVSDPGECSRELIRTAPAVSRTARE